MRRGGRITSPFKRGCNASRRGRWPRRSCWQSTGGTSKRHSLHGGGNRGPPRQKWMWRRDPSIRKRRLTVPLARGWSSSRDEVGGRSQHRRGPARSPRMDRARGVGGGRGGRLSRSSTLGRTAVNRHVRGRRRGELEMAVARLLPIRTAGTCSARHFFDTHSGVRAWASRGVSLGTPTHCRRIASTACLRTPWSSTWSSSAVSNGLGRRARAARGRRPTPMEPCGGSSLRQSAHTSSMDQLLGNAVRLLAAAALVLGQANSVDQQRGDGAHAAVRKCAARMVGGARRPWPRRRAKQAKDSALEIVPCGSPSRVQPAAPRRREVAHDDAARASGCEAGRVIIECNLQAAERSHDDEGAARAIVRGTVKLRRRLRTEGKWNVGAYVSGAEVSRADAAEHTRRHEVDALEAHGGRSSPCDVRAVPRQVVAVAPAKPTRRRRSDLSWLKRMAGRLRRRNGRSCAADFAAGRGRSVRRPALQWSNPPAGPPIQTSRPRGTTAAPSKYLRIFAVVATAAGAAFVDSGPHTAGEAGHGARREGAIAATAPAGWSPICIGACGMPYQLDHHRHHRLHHRQGLPRGPPPGDRVDGGTACTATTAIATAAAIINIITTRPAVLYGILSGPCQSAVIATVGERHPTQWRCPPTGLGRLKLPCHLTAIGRGEMVRRPWRKENLQGAADDDPACDIVAPHFVGDTGRMLAYVSWALNGAGGGLGHRVREAWRTEGLAALGYIGARGNMLPGPAAAPVGDAALETGPSGWRSGSSSRRYR